MIENILDLALKNGLWAALFSFLLFYVLKDSSSREKRYIETIAKLTKHLDIVEDIKHEIDNIKEVLNGEKATGKQRTKKQESPSDKKQQNI